ncbi:MAG: tetratricopeptide repeat protein [Gallionellaceae bacterium]|nr:MAG: tetratricopeptide repeat protein [Gallionellaceae bacterium]
MSKTGRNDPCPCGSGKKYKQCCMHKDSAPASANLVPLLLEQALTHHRKGELPQAETLYQQILTSDPNHPDALHLSGVIASQIGLYERAVALIGKAIALSPSSSMYCNLGNAFKHQGLWEDAAESYAQAIKLNPGDAELHNNLGKLLKTQGKLDDAAACYRTALALKPDAHLIHSNLGNALKEQGKLQEAIASYNRALALKADYADGHRNLGLAHKDSGNLDAAVACFAQALALNPFYTDALSNLLYLHAFTRIVSPHEELRLAAGWEKTLLDDAQRTAARKHALSAFERMPRSGRKLRIGIVSAEIGQHAVAEFLEPLLANFDRARLHVTLYPTTPRNDARALRIKQLADEFKPLAALSDLAAANQIRTDKIDVLIDTTAHMSGCRLGIFAHRAAPVQCHYIGYHGSTGLTEMDWFIADENLLPASCDAHFREKIWRLPRLWIAYRGDTALPESRWQPAEPSPLPNPGGTTSHSTKPASGQVAGYLPQAGEGANESQNDGRSNSGTVWLGSFNNLTKVREATLRLWAKTLHAVPHSKLLLKDQKAADHSVQQRIRGELAQHGIAAGRVEFAARVPDWKAHMALYDRLDIALDSIPLNSGTTAFDALWMGVPILAIEGDWMGGRLTSTILKGLGKPEWVARDEDEYIAKVAALARDVAGRVALRAGQRALMARSPLCDAAGLARALEDAFEAMYDTWLEKK